MIILEPQWSIAWHVSPLDENPEVVTFDFLHELIDWVQDKENTVDCFDINLCTIKELN